ncbi:hypothetical protein N657DRAFT_177997 [Parathielavia appendiculata]|uniref:Uncharacterized protein n=1 Tax=Parathielavia appendiculata TaxID=2587402 RepID=A0AAN6Z6D0_9PEZI|nr:hypothetical protein N657DRAFT_177997 [Parathielavia appendiculata]
MRVNCKQPLRHARPVHSPAQFTPTHAKPGHTRRGYGYRDAVDTNLNPEFQGGDNADATPTANANAQPREVVDLTGDVENTVDPTGDDDDDGAVDRGGSVHGPGDGAGNGENRTFQAADSLLGDDVSGGDIDMDLSSDTDGEELR